MKRNEPFREHREQSGELSGLSFELAHKEDLPDLVELMQIRNPHLPVSLIQEKIQNEIFERVDGKRYGLFVTKYAGKLIGFCRYFFSEDVPSEKVKYPFPKGCFCMGLMVHPDYRGQGVAKFLARNRFNWLKNLDIKVVYSAVAVDNPTSVQMHRSFGFVEVERAPGILNVTFDCGEGILFRKEF